MTDEHFQFLTDTGKRFEVFAGMAAKLASDMKFLSHTLIKLDNLEVSLEKRCKEAEKKLEATEARIRERELLADQGTAMLRKSLDTRQLALIEREAKVGARENMLREQEQKINKLLAAAESRVAEVAPAPAKPEPVVAGGKSKKS